MKMFENKKNINICRRRFLKVTGSGVIATSVGGVSALSSLNANATPFDRKFTLVSPRGTIDVVDDYPYWIAKEMGYFGNLDTTMEPGPSDGNTAISLVASNLVDAGFPPPGAFSYALNNNLDFLSVWGSGAYDLFNFAFRKGEGVKDIKELEGKTILLGSAGWKSICDPMLASAGVDPRSINYIEAGWPNWGFTLRDGQGDACLAWEGLRADWEGKGLQLDYWLGRKSSPLPSNSIVVRRRDTVNRDRNKFLKKYFRGWAMGSEFAERNPRAATQIVFNALPKVRENLGPKFATESLMQIHQTFKGNMAKREGWGHHDLAQWNYYFKLLKKIGQSDINVNVKRVISNEFVSHANNFNKEKVYADADTYKLSAEMKNVDTRLIKKNFFSNVVN